MGLFKSFPGNIYYDRPELVTDPAYLVTRRLEDYEDYNINSHNFKIGIYLVTGLISFNGFKLQKRL